MSSLNEVQKDRSTASTESDSGEKEVKRRIAHIPKSVLQESKPKPIPVDVKPEQVESKSEEEGVEKKDDELSEEDDGLSEEDETDEDSDYNRVYNQSDDESKGEELFKNEGGSYVPHGDDEQDYDEIVPSRNASSSQPYFTAEPKF